MYHAVDMNKAEAFVPRGNVSVTSLNAGSVSAVQQPLSSSQKNLLKVNGYLFVN